MLTGADLPAAVGALRPLYRDDDVVAVCKPEGMAAVGERRDDVDCLAARLARLLGARLWPVHRLDKEASGVMLFALTPDAHRFLNRAFEARRVDKHYLAAVHGSPAAAAGGVERPIRAFGSGRMGVDDARGKPSFTAYRVVARAPRYTLLAARPSTGRRHQIRVHLYHIGHPIVGDPRYGDAARQAVFPRLMLHAAGLALDLPSGRRLELSAVPSATFDAVCARMLGLPRGAGEEGGEEGAQFLARERGNGYSSNE